MFDLHIDLRGISKSYVFANQKRCILNNFDLSVCYGEKLVILGDSGSGKSSLLYLIGLLDKPDAGEYYLKNVLTGRICDKDLQYIFNREIGFIFQDAYLLPNLTVFDNVVLPLVYRGTSFYVRAKLALKYLRYLGLNKMMHAYPNTLSGGEKQRVAIARAFVSGADLILADEPTASLDKHNADMVFNLLNEACDIWKKTLLMVTHDENIASKIERKLYIPEVL